MSGLDMTVTRPSLPVVPSLLFPDLLLALLVAVRPSPPWRLLSFCLHTFICVSALTYTSGDGMQDYSLGSAFAGKIFTAFHLLWMTDPVKEYRHENDVAPPQQLSLIHRMYWAICATHNLRGTDWNYKVVNIPPPPRDNRQVFIRSSILRALRCFIIMDLAQSYIHSNPLFALTGAQALSVTSQGYLLRFLNIMACMCTPYAMLNIQYSLLGALTVAIGIYEPKSWPNVYGNWSDAYTIRRFWGRTWHQFLRRWLSSIGKFIARSLGCVPGSWSSSYMQLYIGFILSGLMHAGGDAMVEPRFFGRSFFFFISQAVAITFEDAVIGLAKKVNLAQDGYFVRLVGYSWVFLWFYISGPWFINWSLEAGLHRSEILPFSPTRKILGIITTMYGVSN